MRTRKAASLLLSLLLVLGLLSGARGPGRRGGGNRDGSRGRGRNGPRRQLLHNEPGGPSGPRGRLRRGQLQPERHGLPPDGPRPCGSDFASIPTFGGVFEGGGHTISGLSLTANRLAHGLLPLYTARRGGKGAEPLRRGEAGRLRAVRRGPGGEQRGQHQGLLLHRHGRGPHLHGRPRRRKRGERLH